MNVLHSLFMNPPCSDEEIVDNFQKLPVNVNTFFSHMIHDLWSIVVSI